MLQPQITKSYAEHENVLQPRITESNAEHEKVLQPLITESYAENTSICTAATDHIMLSALQRVIDHGEIVIMSYDQDAQRS